MNCIASRLLNQQLVMPQYASPEDLVYHMGAMQAQEYRQMRWSVAMRTKKPSAKAFEKAYNDGKIVRLHLMRGTWQLVSAQDYGWMLALCAEKAAKVIGGWMKANKISIPEDEYAKIREILLRTTSDKRSVTKEDYEEALQQKGLQMDEHRLSYHIRMAELRGDICSGDLDAKHATYSLVLEKLGTFEPIEREEALTELARRYFVSRGPATLEDFVWWSGMNIGDCRSAVASLGKELKTEHYREWEFYVHESCRTKRDIGQDPLLVPAYDEYLIGYKSRQLVLDPQYQQWAHNNSGIFYPIIVKEGRVCGNWRPFAKAAQSQIWTGEDFSIEKEWNRYKHYLEN